MEIEEVENVKPSTLSSTDIEHHVENTDPQITNHVDKEPKCDISAEEVRSIIEVMATTGKFWHDWDMLKIMLSARLKQVLSEYPESQMVSGDVPQQTSLAGQTYQDTVTRLDEALLGFIEGPPFTLQRLCEILLTPKSTYKSLSKLALALEKNLLVTSTLTLCTDPYPTAPVQKPVESDPYPLAPVQKPVESEPYPLAPVQKSEEPEPNPPAPAQKLEDLEPHPTAPSQNPEEVVIRSEGPEDVSNSGSNGVETAAVDADEDSNGVETAAVDADEETAAVDADEEMTDAEAEPEPEPEPEQFEDAMNTDTEMREEKLSETPESNATSSSEGGPSKEE